MTIIYDNKIKKKMSDVSSIKWFYGKLSNKIIIRISLLSASNCLGEIPNLPPTRRHKLIGNYKNCWGIEIEKNWRIIIRPLDENILNPDEIKEIIILDIVDYH